MKICASSVCWWADSRVSMMKKVVDAGFKAVEILTFPEPEVCKCHGDLRTMKVADLRRELNDHGLTLSGLHLGGIKSAPEEHRRSLIDYIKLGVEFCVELGGGVIVETGPDRANEPIEPFMKAVEELVPFFEKTPVKLALENHYYNWLQYIQDYEWVFSRVGSPSVGMTLDTGHFTSANVDPAEVAKRFGKRVAHVHVKDHIGTHSVALGEGRTNNFAVVHELKMAGYAGYLSQEVEVEDKSRVDQVGHDGYKYMALLLEASKL